MDLLNENNEKISIKAVSKSIFKIYFSSNYAKFRDIEDKSFSTELNNLNSIKSSWTTKDKATYLSSMLLDEKNLIISFDTTTGSLQLLINEKENLNMFLRLKTNKEWLSISIEFQTTHYKCFGFGEQTNPMDKQGKRIIFWNTDNPSYKIGLTPLYQSWPIVIIQISDFLVAFIFDNPAYSEINLQEIGKINYYVNDNQLKTFFLVSKTFKELMEKIREITGAIFPLPKWALGYQQSRWSYTPSQKVLEVAETFRDKKIPCDVIYLDIDYMDNFKCFTFGPEFTDYHDLIDKLHSLGFKVVPIIDPGIKVEKGYSVYEEGVRKKYFLTNPQGEIITIKVWPGESHFPDFVNSKVQDWWSILIEQFIDDSKVDGIWCDMNEPSTFDARRTLQPDATHLTNEYYVSHEKLHNVFGYLMSKATYLGLTKKTKTPFVLTRSTYLGGQKYAATWTGDNVSSWAHLQASIPMILSLSLSGQPIVGPDIGGFNGKPDAKLYDRWISQGAFYPYSRTHTAKNTPDQEPWSFNDKVTEKAKKAIKLRYKLIPYYYSLLYESFLKGYPILRPIFFNDFTENSLNKDYYETEFLIGDFLLFTPFMTKHDKREIYLPPNNWFSWWNKEEIYQGNSIQTYEEDENEITPIFIKDEAIIPMNSKSIQFISDTSEEELSILITVKDSSTELHFDFIEYFDQDTILGLKIIAKKDQNIIRLVIREIRQGAIPENHFLPKIIHLQINYFVRTIMDLEKELYEIKTDKDDWSEIILLNAQYPMNLQIETLF